MNYNQLLEQVHLKEDSSRQFKVDIRNMDSLAAEMVAFSNSKGGTIFIGVADDGSIPGLSSQDVGRINQMISNAASQHIRSPIAPRTENIALPENENLVIVLQIPKGIDKPYFDKNGVIWLKSGSDKRRVNSKEELRRLFQISKQFHGDELPTKARSHQIDWLRFRKFLNEHYRYKLPENQEDRKVLLQNMNLLAEDSSLNLAAVLMFTEYPEWIAPQFMIKAIRYPGNEIHGSQYLDSYDFTGPLAEQYQGAFGFIKRNLYSIQKDGGINSPGSLEIPQIVFEELLVNALIHRDYLVSAPIRLFIYDDRIEIISPGTLPNNLTIEKIKCGNVNIRNPILSSFVAKGLLPYHGLGSGIIRSMQNWEHITFQDDRKGMQFIVTISRSQERSNSLIERQDSSKTTIDSPIEGVDSPKKMTDSAIEYQDSPKKTSDSPIDSPIEYADSPNVEELILALLQSNPKLSTQKIAIQLDIHKRTVLNHIDALKKQGRLQRIGPSRGGYWKFPETK